MEVTSTRGDGLNIISVGKGSHSTALRCMDPQLRRGSIIIVLAKGWSPVEGFQMFQSNLAGELFVHLYLTLWLGVPGVQ